MICSSNIFFNQYKMMTNTQQGGSIHEGSRFFFVQIVETKFKDQLLLITIRALMKVALPRQRPSYYFYH
ncbi:hypothetical protein ES332_D03G137000v1 [Gossypium tomentosum]|uniref:Uncharacterized protein n=1 Tax=Gossypium tomentosum TaxID=34277 RepID=A0A5D2LMC0_GOSTO|nr:hypothetical protein ES332_D03G137000v1 [Gossypium tomentosum]